MAPYNHDVVMVPRGYHPVAAIAGYDSYYLNVMAGPDRKWLFTGKMTTPDQHAGVPAPRRRAVQKRIEGRLAMLTGLPEGGRCFSRNAPRNPTPDPASAAPPEGTSGAIPAFVPDGATLIRPTGASISSYPGPASAAPGRTPQTPYPFCAGWRYAYPAYGILP